MSFFRPPIDPNNIIEAPIPIPIEGGRTRMAGERPSRVRRKRPEEIESAMEEAFERRGRGRRAGRRVGGTRRRRRGGSKRGTIDKKVDTSTLTGGRTSVKDRTKPKTEGERTIGDKVRGSGFSCPDPNMRILMANGSQKKAGELVVGDVVSTYHEKDLEKASKKSLVLASGGTEKHSQLRDQLENSYAKATLGEYKVEFVDIVKDVEKIKLTFEGSEIICSLTHNFYVNDSWKEAKDMVIGDEVSDKKLVAIEDVEDGDVVHITIEDAHTYICEDLLSHNKRRPNPNKGRGVVVGGKKGGGTKYVTMRDPETGYKYGGKVVDGVPQFTKPDFSDRKPLPGYPKKETDRPTGTGGKRSDPRGPNRPPKTDKPTGGRGPRRDPPRGPRGPRGPRKPSGFMQGIADKIFEIASKGATGSGTGFLGVKPDMGVTTEAETFAPPTGGRGPRRDPYTPGEGRGGEGGSRTGRTGVRGRRRVRDEAFERRRSMGSPRKTSRRERRRRVRQANTPMIK